MPKKFFTHLACAMASAGALWVYMALSPPVWWNESLHISEVIVQSKIDKPVYVTHEMKEIAFRLHQGDRCLDIANQSFSFGEPDTKDLEYRKMLVVCPGIGIGWVENSW
jgi:hypothetical protein